MPANQYDVTISADGDRMTITKDAGLITVKSTGEETYTAGITATVSVTPYEGAAKYVVSQDAASVASPSVTLPPIFLVPAP